MEAVEDKDLRKVKIKARRRRVRPVSRPTSCVRLKELRCFAKVDSMIKEGYSATSIARYIREDRGEYADVAFPSVVKQIERYRASIPPLEIAATRLPERVARAMSELEETVDELQELTKLYKMQMERIGIDAELEKSLKKLFPTLGAEVKLAMQILQASASLKQDMGLLKRDLGTISVDSRVLAAVADIGNDKMRAAVADPESRRRIVGVFERLMALKPDLRAKIARNAGGNGAGGNGAGGNEAGEEQ